MQRRTQLKRIVTGELGASLRVPAASLIEQVACQSIIVATFSLGEEAIMQRIQVSKSQYEVSEVRLPSDKLRTRGEIH